jgi:hypothetical protein
MKGGQAMPVYRTSSILQVDDSQSTVAVVPTNAWVKKDLEISPLMTDEFRKYAEQLYCN